MSRRAQQSARTLVELWVSSFDMASGYTMASKPFAVQVLSMPSFLPVIQALSSLRRQESSILSMLGCPLRANKENAKGKGTILDPCLRRDDGAYDFLLCCKA